jgi:hypothetical protein
MSKVKLPHIRDAEKPAHLRGEDRPGLNTPRPDIFTELDEPFDQWVDPSRSRGTVGPPRLRHRRWAVEDARLRDVFAAESEEAGHER